MTDDLVPSDRLVFFLTRLAEEFCPPAVINRLVSEAELACKRDLMRSRNPHLCAFAAEAAVRLREGEISKDVHSTEVSRRQQIVADLLDLVAQWHNIARLGGNPIASKALSMAGDALAEVLKRHSTLPGGDPQSPEPRPSRKIPPPPVGHNYG